MLTNDVGTLKEGDKIRIDCPGQGSVTGRVLSASFYGGRDGWFIEVRGEDGRYHYWKQGPDGGTVRKIHPEPTGTEIREAMKKWKDKQPKVIL